MNKEKSIVLIILVICFMVFGIAWYVQESHNVEPAYKIIGIPNVLGKLEQRTKPQRTIESTNQEVEKEDKVENANEIPIVEQTTINEIPITSRDSNDLYANDGETIGTIKCDRVGLYTAITYGDSQSNIDLYDVTQQYNLQINSSANVLLAGHNNKSFAKLFTMIKGDILQIHSYYGDFTYVVTSIAYGIKTDDDSNIVDEQGNQLYDAYSRENKIIMYTCGSSPNDRLVVTAIPI